MLGPRYYFDQSIYDSELSRIFSGHFQFAGLTTELSRNRDFICVDYPGCSVVVQNFKGQLRAFKNVCTHRFNKIQTNDRGNRPLMCSYHGWNFDETGFPAAIPNKQQFLLENPDSSNNLCLMQYRVEVCGKFVFFTMDLNAPPLKQYLGRYYEILEEISGAIGPETHFGAAPHAANWKLLVENVLECYHCSIVHQQTFISGLGVGKLPMEQVRFEGPHSSCHFPKDDSGDNRARRRALAHLEKRLLTHSSYYHIYIFPNLFIASIEGMTFYIGHVLPIGPRESTLRIRFYEAAVELTPNQRALQNVINEQNVPFGHRVIDEDRVILENVQKGVELTDKPGILGRDEVRIQKFIDAYGIRMAVSPPIAALT